MSSKPARVSGHINVRYGVEMELAINAIAAKHAMQRNEWLRRLAQEALHADEEGRPLFQVPEGPRIDSSLNVLAAELREIVVEWERIRRENDRRDRRAIELLAEGEEANRLALARVNRLVLETNRQSYEPFVDKVKDLIEGLNVVNERCAASINACLEPLMSKIEKIEALAEQPRVINHYQLGKDWVLSHWQIIIGAWLLIAGLFGGLIVPGFTNAMAVNHAGHLITTDYRMCQLIERQYRSADCTVPAASRKRGTAAGIEEADQ